MLQTPPNWVYRKKVKWKYEIEIQKKNSSRRSRTKIYTNARSKAYSFN